MIIAPASPPLPVRDGAADAPLPPASTPDAGWALVSAGAGAAATAVHRPLNTRRIVLALVLGVAAALVAVGFIGALGARLLAEREAMNDAVSLADVFAEAIVQPALTNDLADGDPSAVAVFDATVHQRVLGPNVVRVKLWGPDGTVIYSDESTQIGQTFTLSPDQLAALSHPQTRAEVSDLKNAEHDLDNGGPLLEVYRPVWAPDGRELLFEMYSPYAAVAARSADLWRGFAGVTVTSLLLLVLLTAPIVWYLLRRIRRSDAARAALLQNAIDASDAERRRIAGTLHDGPVQQLVATSYAAEGVAASATARGEIALAGDLRIMASSVRGGVRALRSLLVDIYPPSLAAAGLAHALDDLADTVRRRGVSVTLELSADPDDLTDADQRLIYRVAQECLRNTVAHAAPCTGTVRLYAQGADTVLDVADDGPGFDRATLDAEDDHFGTRVLADVAEQAGASLSVRTAPGEGTAWRLVIPARSGS